MDTAPHSALADDSPAFRPRASAARSVPAAPAAQVCRQCDGCWDQVRSGGVSPPALTQLDSPHGMLDDVVDPDAGGRLHRLFRWAHDRSLVTDIRHGEPMRPRKLADSRHQRISGRPADTDVDEITANGVLGDREPLSEAGFSLIIGQRVGAVERREGADEVTVEGPDRRGGALKAVIAMRLLLPGDPIPPLGKALIRDRARLEDQEVVAHASRLPARMPPSAGTAAR